MATDKDWARLRELGEQAKSLRYSPDTEKADKVRLDRDKLIYRLMWDGVSPSRIAHVANVHRVFTYRIKDSARLAALEAEQQ